MIVTGVVALVSTVFGERVPFPGAGLLTATVAAVEVPPPGAALMAVSDSVPEAETSAAVSATLT